MNTSSTTSIVDLNGQPFSDFDQASALRDLLARETGAAYRVDRNEAGKGFVVRRVNDQRLSGTIGNLEFDSAGNVNELRKDLELAPWVLRPALRMRLPIQLPLMVLGLYLCIHTASILSQILGVLPFSIPLGFDTHWLIGGLRLIGLFFFLSSLWSIWIPWLSSRYRISMEGISMEHGIIARNVVQVRYPDIRSVGLDQGLIERLFNVGTVEFTAAGTDKIDIAFVGIARPTVVRTAVQTRMDLSA